MMELLVHANEVFGQINQMDCSLKWLQWPEVDNVGWKIIPYIYYSHAEERGPCSAATEGFVQFIGMTPSACAEKFKEIISIYACDAKPFSLPAAAGGAMTQSGRYYYIFDPRAQSRRH